MSTTISRLYNWVTDKANSVLITASRVDAEMDQVIVALNRKALCAGSAPSSPIAGQTWLDTSVTPAQLKVYNGTSWQDPETIKGADISSATTTDIGAATGRFIDVTGTTTITGLGTIRAGVIRTVRFTGALILTHNGTSLLLPSAANITTVANDTAEFVSLGSGNWKCLWYQRYTGAAIVGAAVSGTSIQTVFTKSSAVATSTGTAVNDDTIPTLTECPVLTALNTAITASSTSNTLIITATLQLAANTGNYAVAALFLDGDSAASAAILFNTGSGNADFPNTFVVTFSVTPADTSAHTYKIGIGGIAGIVITMNGTASARKLGGVMYSSMRIDEIKA